MSYWVAGAAIGSAIIGAVSSNNAANKSANAAKAGIKSTTDLAKQSRLDAINLFNQGKQSRMLGQNAAFDFYKQNAQNISRPMVQGNMMAQQVQGQGGIQANNAILGLPVDMSFANNPQQVSADYSAINAAQLPQLGTSYNVLQSPEQTAASTAKSGVSSSLDPVNVAKVPSSNQFLASPQNIVKRTNRLLGF